jgi:hypothetical protein
VLVSEYAAGRRSHAPAAGAPNARALLVKTDPTWREAVVGSAFLLNVLGVGLVLAVVGAAVLRRRRSR